MPVDAHSYHRAADLLAGAPLMPILEKIRTHRLILDSIKEGLPQNLAEHCLDCVIAANQRLILYTDAPAWSFQLRFHAPVLLERLSAHSRHFRALEVRSLPAASPGKRGRSKPPVATPDAARMVQDCSLAVSSNELAAALRRLATTLGAGCVPDEVSKEEHPQGGENCASTSE